MSSKLSLFWFIFWSFGSLIACLSLNEIHSSSQTFKSIPKINTNRDENLKTAIDSIHRRRQEYPIAQTFDSIPFEALEYYERLVPFAKKQDEVVEDVPLGYTQMEGEFSSEPLNNDLYSSALAMKLSQLLEQDNEGQYDIGHRIFNRINNKQKRSTSKQNNYYIKPNALKLKNRGIINKNKNKTYKRKSISSKAKIKRKSGRRVLNDHFNVEENIENAVNVRNGLKNLKSSKISKLDEKIENKLNEQKNRKKLINKRKVDSTMTRDYELKANESKTTDKTIVSELNDILSDDNKKGKSETNSNEMKSENNTINKSSFEGKLKKQNIITIKKINKRSDYSFNSLIQQKSNINDYKDDGNDIIYPTEDNVDNHSDSEKSTNTQDLDEWLRREYYQNIAKALATMRRKRSDISNILSEDNNDGNGDDNSDGNSDDNNDSINNLENNSLDNLIAIDESNENTDNTNSNTLETNGKLNEDNDDYVLAIEGDNNDNNKDSDELQSKDSDEWVEWENIELKSKPKKTKRSVSAYFGEIGDNEETNDIDIDSNRFSKINNKLESIEDSLLIEAINLIHQMSESGQQSDADAYMIKNRIDAAYDIEDIRTGLDNFKDTVDKINHESDDQIDDKIDIKILPVLSSNQFDVQKRDELDNPLSESESEEKCFALESLTNDCSSVAALVPTSRLQYLMTEACNWHQICYTCGEIYGLLSSECDAGFLEASRLACDGSPSCETFARLVLSPLRQSRVFYKSSVPQTCFQYQCIRDFLIDTKNIKH